MATVSDTIDPSSKLPLYHQLYEILRRKLITGDMKPGDMVPPESELTAHYQVSRTTVRQVLDMLVKEGLIYRQRGRGTFVAHPTVEQALTRIISFTDDMRQRGFEPGARVLYVGLVAAPADIARRLEVPAGEPLARIYRLRLADGEPMALEESFLLHRLFPGITEMDHSSRSLQETVTSYDVRWSRAKQSIRAIPAAGEHARLLAAPRRSALLCIERVSYTQQGVAAEFLRIHYRGDRYVLFADLSG